MSPGKFCPETVPPQCWRLAQVDLDVEMPSGASGAEAAVRDGLDAPCRAPAGSTRAISANTGEFRTLMGVCCEGWLARNVNKAPGTQGEQVGSVLESSGDVKNYLRVIKSSSRVRSLGNVHAGYAGTLHYKGEGVGESETTRVFLDAVAVHF